MKFVFLAGGVCGFLLALVTSWQLDHAPDRVLLDGAVGCLAGAMLFRWFWKVVLAGLRDTVLARHRASVALHAAAATPATSAPPAKGK